MFDQEINEQLGLLQNELSRLKSATDYIDSAKSNSSNIIIELEKVQHNYTSYLDNIFNLCKQFIADIKQDTQIQINDGILKFETTGNNIDAINREKLVATKRLLEQYKNIVESTDNLVKTVESINFPLRLETIENNIKALNNLLTEGRQSIENKITENHGLIIHRLNHHDKELKAFKIILFITLAVTVIGMAVLILKFR